MAGSNRRSTKLKVHGKEVHVHKHLANSPLSSTRYLRLPLMGNRLVMKNEGKLLSSILSYGFPCCRSFPAALTALSLPCSFKSSYDIISPQTNLFSKSELAKCQGKGDLITGIVETYWMTPAAWGAFVAFRMVHALTSSGPQVKYRISLKGVRSNLRETRLHIHLSYCNRPE